jgi:hypothetical protein
MSVCQSFWACLQPWLAEPASDATVGAGLRSGISCPSLASLVELSSTRINAGGRATGLSA